MNVFFGTGNESVKALGGDIWARECDKTNVNEAYSMWAIRWAGGWHPLKPSTAGRALYAMPFFWLIPRDPVTGTRMFYRKHMLRNEGLR